MASGQDATHVRKVDRLCGYWERERELPSRKNNSSSEFADYSLAKASVSLYRRDDAGDCCAQLTARAQQTTRRSGKFAFKRFIAGNYWIARIVQGRQHNVPIEFTRNADNFGDCKEFLYTVDHLGNLAMKSVITVD
jgi:hypothetical protein